MSSVKQSEAHAIRRDCWGALLNECKEEADESELKSTPVREVLRQMVARLV